MHFKNLAIGLGMTLGVQLVPGAWVKQGDYVVPNSGYTLKKGGPGYVPGGADYKPKTGNGATSKGGSGTSGGGSGTSGGSGGGSGGSGGSGFGGGSGGGGGSVFGGGSGGASCAGTVTLSEGRGLGDILKEDHLNDALPYAWAKKFWLCSCPFSLEGSGLYWDTRPIVMCAF